MEFPQSTARVGGHPIHPMLVPFPIACYVFAFVTDIAYWQTGWAMWAYASSWLIGVGIATALLAAIAGFIDFFGSSRIRGLRAAWWHMLGNLTGTVLSIVNFIVHMRDGAAAVLPTGIVLSGAVVAILLVTGWLGGEMVYRHGVAVRPKDGTAP